jgi:hypothetical protein
MDDEQALSTSYFSVNLKFLKVAPLHDFIQPDSLSDVSSMIYLRTGHQVWDFMYHLRQTNQTAYTKMLELIGPNPFWRQSIKPYPTLFKIVQKFRSVVIKYKDMLQFEPTCYVVRPDGSLIPSIIGTECFVQTSIVFEQPCSGRRITFAQAFEYKQELMKLLVQAANIQDNWLMYCSLLDSMLTQ